jgi:hypothetical protein
LEDDKQHFDKTSAVDNEEVIENDNLIEEGGTSKEENSYSEDEKEAISKGWRPKEEFKGELRKWKPASEWLEQKELYDRISHQNKQMKEMREMVNKLVNFAVEDKKKNAHGEAQRLKQLRDEAIRRGDVSAVDELDGHLEIYKKEVARYGEKENSVQQEAKDFQQRNLSWFNEETAENSSMRQYAIRKESEIMRTYPYMNLKECLDLVEKSTLDFFGKTSKQHTKRQVETSIG